MWEKIKCWFRGKHKFDYYTDTCKCGETSVFAEGQCNLDEETKTV